VALMRRRSVVAALLGLAATPAFAQPTTSPRIGVLMFSPLTEAAKARFRAGLRKFGYVEGTSATVVWRSAEGRADRTAALAAELVQQRVDVIVAEFTPSVRAARGATTTIPIVMAPAGDPVATGLVASLARPGGNVTGVNNIATGLSGKRLELLREAIPRLARVGLLIHGSDPLDREFVDETRAAATAAGVALDVASVPRPADLDQVLAGMAKARVGAVVVPGNLPLPYRETAAAALRHKLPTISLFESFPDAGGLMSYGPSQADIQERAAGYVDRILRGAKPGDLPVESPTRFELVVNLATAKALGIAVPRALALRADRVIE
jgi:putative ABC transport system substrate-binding protein